MASCISPRPGYTPHTFTIHLADPMRSLVDRADRFQPMQGDERVAGRGRKAGAVQGG